MARLWYDAAGAILRVCRDDAEEARYGAPPGAAGSVAFDESANAAAIAGLAADWQAHTCSAGTLRRNGSPVALAADDPATTARRQAKTQGAALLAALRAGTATGAQVQRALAYLLAQELKRDS